MNNCKKRTKLCFAASSGGHYEQLLMLKPLMEKHDSFILTERTAYVSEQKDITSYYLKQVNRKDKYCLWYMLQNCFSSILIFIKEQPTAVICTGVLAMIPMCLLAKLFRRKLIYIESFAKVTSPTRSGRLLYKFADQFFVQWESMLDVYPDALYVGSIY